MAVNLVIPDRSAVYPVDGVEIGIASAGIRKPSKKDLTVFRLTPGTMVAGVFTKNRFRAAPVKRCETNLASHTPIQALVINTGNANAGTGQPRRCRRSTHVRGHRASTWASRSSRAALFDWCDFGATTR